MAFGLVKGGTASTRLVCSKLLGILLCHISSDQLDNLPQTFCPAVTPTLAESTVLVTVT